MNGVRPDRPGPWVVLLVALAACGDPRADWPAADATGLGIEVRATVERAELGVPFELEVRRRHPRELVPAELDPTGLAPLAVEALDVVRETHGDEVLEVHRLRARAFALDSVPVPPVVFLAVPSTGGDPLATTSLGFELPVAGALDPADPGPVELPGGPLAPPRPPSRWRTPLALAALVGGAAAWTMRRRRGGAGDGLEPRRAHEAARADLRALERALGEGRAPDRRWCAALASVLRAYLEVRFRFPARACPTSRLLRDARLRPWLRADERARLAEVLDACDGVLYGAAELAPERARTCVAQARELVEATRVAHRPHPVAEEAGTDAVPVPTPEPTPEPMGGRS